MIIDYPGSKEPIKRRRPLTNHERRHELQINFSQQIDAKYGAGLSIMILFQIDLNSIQQRFIGLVPS